jgi:hypothetical protein
LGGAQQVRCLVKTGGCGSKININKKNIIIKWDKGKKIRTESRTKDIIPKSYPADYSRAQMRALKIFLGLSEGGHKKGQTVYSDAQDIISHLLKFMEMRKK